MDKILIPLLALTFSPLMQLSAQTAAPVAPHKLVLRLKATLPDYKGPSKFRGRKALVTFSLDGRLVAISGTNRTITVWDTETGALKAKLTASDGVSGFSFSPDGKTAATRDFLDKSVRIWDLQTWEVKNTLTGRKKNL